MTTRPQQEQWTRHQPVSTHTARSRNTDKRPTKIRRQRHVDINTRTTQDNRKQTDIHTGPGHDTTPGPKPKGEELRRRSQQSTGRKIYNIITTVLVAIVVVAAVLLVGAKVIGLQTYSVLSGSMEPTYHTGSLIYVKKTDPQDIKVGDPITFVLDENLTVATHRVIKIDDPNQHFYTQGDANEYPDASPVHYKNLIGKPFFTRPYLCYFAGYVQNPPGKYLALAAAAIIILLVFLPDLFDDKDKDKDSKGRGRRRKDDEDSTDATPIPGTDTAPAGPRAKSGQQIHRPDDGTVRYRWVDKQ